MKTTAIKDTKQVPQPTAPLRLATTTSFHPVTYTEQLPLQKRLTINSAGDRYEVEADRVAEQVMGMNEPRLQQRVLGGTPAVQGQSESMVAEHDVPLAVHQALSSPGQPLDAATRAFMEPRFGHDFARVRVYADDRAAKSARALHALAYTVAPNIVFGTGDYAPQTNAGQRLLAHELTHIVQQQRSGVPIQILREPAEPPRPQLSAKDRVAFEELSEDEVVADPRASSAPDRAHGITIVRRGEDLFYLLPGGSERLVPRPTKPNGMQVKIDSIYWGGLGNAFSVHYVGDRIHSIDVEPFILNAQGEGSIEKTDFEPFLHPDPGPGGLTVHPEGLEVERNAKILTQKRPSESRFKTATRYHVPPAPYSLYLLSDRALEVVEDASAKMLWRREGRDVHDFQMDPAGVARVTWNDPSGIVSVDVDIRGPTLNLKGLGALGESAARSALLSKIDGLGVKVEERGTQFTDVELQAAWDILQTWPDPNMSLIGAFQSHGLPGLTLVKDVAIERAELVDEKVQIPGGIVPSARSQRSAITHEIGHALFAAAGLKLPSELGDAKPEHVTAVAQQLLQESSQGLIEEQRIGAPLKPRTQEDWEQSLSMNKELNEIWAALHHRFAILDPERTGDIRGLDVADESRYLFNVEGDIPGHGFDNVNEFVASFIASSRQFESRMVGTIRYSGSERLATLYRDLWNLVNENISTLGSSNPYDDLINRR